ncbi:MAG TPA: hypothetical protein VFK10_17770 [Burkholderiaceae bacterium]|nr:hypothetical protein [Burkholderiaceae bacterium]
MSRRAAAKRTPRSKSLSLDLPTPRPLSGLERELYELLVGDLEASVEARIKATRRRDKAGAELGAASAREEKLRVQLATFEPTLEGFAVVTGNSANAAAGTGAHA